jgi:hypothetical protein
MRLPQFTMVLLSAIVTIIALGSAGGLDTVEVATMSIVISGALVVWFVRQPRLSRHSRSRAGSR